MGEIEIGIGELVNKIANAPYSYLNYKNEITSNTIVRGSAAEEASQKSTIYSVVAKWINENVVPLQSEISSLKAKLYVYEAVIANSNFKVAIAKDKKDEEQLYTYMNSINANVGEFRLASAEIESKLDLLMTNLDITLNELNKDIQELKNK